MNCVTRLVAAAVLAAGGTALIGVPLAASAIADPSDAVAQVAADGQAEVSYAQTLFGEGYLSNGMDYLVNGENNLVISVPEDTLLTQIESPAQDFYFNEWYPNALPIPTSFDDLSANLQFLFSDGQNLLNEASAAFAQDATNLADGLWVNAFNTFAFGLPEEALLGPLYVAFASLS